MAKVSDFFSSLRRKVKFDFRIRHRWLLGGGLLPQLLTELLGLFGEFFFCKVDTVRGSDSSLLAKLIVVRSVCEPSQRLCQSLTLVVSDYGYREHRLDPPTTRKDGVELWTLVVVRGVVPHPLIGLGHSQEFTVRRHQLDLGLRWLLFLSIQERMCRLIHNILLLELLRNTGSRGNVWDDAVSILVLLAFY